MLSEYFEKEISILKVFDNRLIHVFKFDTNLAFQRTPASKQGCNLPDLIKNASMSQDLWVGELGGRLPPSPPGYALGVWGGCSPPSVRMEAGLR